MAKVRESGVGVKREMTIARGREDHGGAAGCAEQGASLLPPVNGH